MIPYELTIGYDKWTYRKLPLSSSRPCRWAYRISRLTTVDDVIQSILPEELQDEIPSGFNSVGHVGKLDLLGTALPP
jgi:tRNA (guanine37-N1)-methyltransferase